MLCVSVYMGVQMQRGPEEDAGCSDWLLGTTLFPVREVCALNHLYNVVLQL